MKKEEIEKFLDEFCYYKSISDADDTILRQILSIEVKGLDVFFVESNKSETFVLRNYFTNEACIIWDISFWKYYMRFLYLVQQLQSVGTSNEIANLIQANVTDFLAYRVIDNKGLFGYFRTKAFELGIGEFENADVDTTYVRKLLFISKIVALYHEIAHIHFNNDAELRKTRISNLKKDFSELFTEDDIYSDNLNSFLVSLSEEEKDLFKDEKIFKQEEIDVINYYREIYAEKDAEHLWEEMAADYYSARKSFIFVMQNYNCMCCNASELVTYIFDAIDLLNFFNSVCSALGEFWDYAGSILSNKDNLRKFVFLEKMLNKEIDEINSHSILRNTIVNGMIAFDILENDEEYFDFNLSEVDWIPFFRRDIVEDLNDIFTFWCSSQIINDVIEHLKNTD